MRLHPRWRPRPLILLLFVLLAVALAAPARCADRPFTCFVHLTDTHLGSSLDYEAKDKGPLRAAIGEMIRACNEVIKPSQVIVTGDLVSTPSVDNFRDYLAVFKPLLAPLHCLPGNHDLSYGKGPQAYAQVIGPLQHDYFVDGCHFICFDTAPFMGKADIAPSLRWLEAALSKPESKAAPARFLCGHYPFIGLESTPLSGRFRREDFQILGEKAEALVHLMRQYRVSAYLCGHTHGRLEAVDTISGATELMTPPPYDGQFRVVCFDDGILSSSLGSANGWPLIVITSPAPYLIGSSARVEGTMSVRAKVFSPGEVKTVTYRLDKGQPAAMNLGSRGLWEATADVKNVAPGKHALVVEATDAAGRVRSQTIDIVVAHFG